MKRCPTIKRRPERPGYGSSRVEAGVVLALLWAVVLGMSVLLYVILDGFDLGVGILFPWGRDARERDVMMSSIAPMWDGNETWLVLFGGGLMAAFPKAYATLMSALYVPVIFMLFALIFRGVAFEFRFKAGRSRGVWDMAFTFGSVMAAFFQGVLLGAFIQGLEMEGGRYTGGAMGWLTPFSLMTGFALVCGYALLGACWLVMKTEDDLQRWAFRAAQVLLFIVLAWIATVSLFTPLVYPEVARRWFTLPNLLVLSPVPLLTLGLGVALLWSLRQGREKSPLILTCLLFSLGYFGIGISLWPYIVPRHLTLWQTAAPPESQAFLLVGTLCLLPVILGYTAWNYWVFRGKTSVHDSY